MSDRMDSPVVVHNDTRGADHFSQNYGSDNTETIDNDTGTNYGIESHHGGDGSTSCYAQSEHTWDAPIRVSRIEASGQLQYLAGNYFNGDMDVEISLKIDGVWTKIVDDHWDNSPSGSNTWGTRNWTEDLTDGWEGVTGIRVYTYCYAYSYEGNRQQYTRVRINEVSVEYDAGGFAQLI